MTNAITASEGSSLVDRCGVTVCPPGKRTPKHLIKLKQQPRPIVTGAPIKFRTDGVRSLERGRTIVVDKEVDAAETNIRDTDVPDITQRAEDFRRQFTPHQEAIAARSAQPGDEELPDSGELDHEETRKKIERTVGTRSKPDRDMAKGLVEPLLQTYKQDEDVKAYARWLKYGDR